MTDVSMTKTSLQFVDVRWFDRRAVGIALRLKPVNKQFSTVTAMIGVQHVPIVKVRRRIRQFLDQMFTGWIALLLPLHLEESRLSFGHGLMVQPTKCHGD